MRACASAWKLVFACNVQVRLCDLFFVCVGTVRLRGFQCQMPANELFFMLVDCLGVLWAIWTAGGAIVTAPFAAAIPAVVLLRSCHTCIASIVEYQ